MCGLVVLFLLPLPVPDVTLADLSRFPPRQACQDAVERLDEYGRWCADMASHEGDGYHRAPWLAMADDAYSRRLAWEALSHAHWCASPPCWPEPTKADLRRLREMIGPAAYVAGRLPAVPACYTRK